MKKAEEAIPTAIYDTEKADQELQAQYGVSDANYKPAFLYVERGPGAGQLLEVKQGTVVIGRASVSDLRLQHPSISRRHAQVRRVGEQFFVKDLGSQNGCFVNKARIANEVEAKIGDTIALGNALLRLRGPMQKGEKSATSQSGRARPTAVVPRAQYSTGQVKPVGSNRMVKIAVFAGAVGFGLAAMLTFAVFFISNGAPSTAPSPAEPKVAAAAEPSDPIARALEKKQAVAAVAPARAAPPPAEVPIAADEPTIQEGATTVVPRADAAPTVAPARVSPSASRVAPAPRKASAPVEPEPKAAGGRRSQVLAPYERGNAEGSLELARSAGDKALASQLTNFISAYDNGQDALLTNNGTLAIKEFTKALALDEQLSSGAGKYSAEIRKHLGNLYFLVGKQYASGGDDEKARAAYAAALKHDPSNAKARSALGSVASSDDEAEAPAPRPAAKKAPSKTSIDDAFGD